MAAVAAAAATRHSRAAELIEPGESLLIISPRAITKLRPREVGAQRKQPKRLVVVVFIPYSNSISNSNRNSLTRADSGASKTTLSTCKPATGSSRHEREDAHQQVAINR